MEINPVYERRCWTCGEEYSENLTGWKQCGGCKVWNCPECLWGCWFFLRYCNKCQKEYCDLCGVDYCCPNCNEQGDLIFAYNEECKRKK